MFAVVVFHRIYESVELGNASFDHQPPSKLVAPVRNSIVRRANAYYNLGSAFGHLAIAVPDVYKACERLAAAGVKIPRPAGPMAHGGSVIAFIEDPDGYRIELIERS